MNRNIVKGLALVGAATYGAAANAAIDITAVSTGITEATTAIVSVITALMALSVAIFGVGKVYQFLKSKAGA